MIEISTIVFLAWSGTVLCFGISIGMFLMTRRAA